MCRFCGYRFEEAPANTADVAARRSAGDRAETDRVLRNAGNDLRQRRFVEAWIAHPQRDVLEQREHEVDASGAPRWKATREVDGDEWVWYWQRPVDPRDDRPSIMIGMWPERLETDGTT